MYKRHGAERKLCSSSSSEGCTNVAIGHVKLRYRSNTHRRRGVQLFACACTQQSSNNYDTSITGIIRLHIYPIRRSSKSRLEEREREKEGGEERRKKSLSTFSNFMKSFPSMIDLRKCAPSTIKQIHHLLTPQSLLYYYGN